MEMIGVKSSNIVSIGYEKTNLYVNFNNGSYVYYNVPKAVYDEMLLAPSKGKYMWSKIRGKYDYKRIKG